MQNSKFYRNIPFTYSRIKLHAGKRKKTVYPVFNKAKRKKGEKAKIENENNDGVEKQLALIYEKLSNMLTKNDTSFLKQIVKDTICELKDDLLKPLIHRIEIMESDIMGQAKEIEKLKDELAKKDTIIESLGTDNKRSADRAKSDANYVDKVTNDLEQYGRRNNIRISDIKDDPSS